DGDTLLTAIADEGGSGLFLSGGTTFARLEPPVSWTDGGDAISLVYPTEDGREATVTVEAGLPEGAARVTFAADLLNPVVERLSARLAVTETEGFYGLMERVVSGAQWNSWDPGMEEALNLRGQTVKLFVNPTLSLYTPFFVSSRGWGLWAESDWPAEYTFGGEEAQDEVLIEYEGPEVSLRVLPGPTPLDATARFARTAGTTIMPPDWAFGPWRWRDDVYDLPDFYDGTPFDGPYNSMIVEDILMMEALGIPCSLYWVDRPWAQGDFGYDDLAWDEARLPHPQEMIQWLEGRGIRFMLWLAPWAVGPQMEAKVAAEGWGLEPYNAFTDVSDVPPLDFTNPDATAWWQDALQPLIAQGVLGFKLDRADEKVPDGLLLQGTAHDGRSFRELHNAYPALYAAAVHGAFQQSGVGEFVVMPRAGWMGTSAHAIVWGGDSGASDWGLRSAIIAAQRAAAMNFPIWGSDTCGYDPRGTHETCARWLGFSAFTPLMEVGPTGNLAFWSWAPDGEEAWVDGEGYHHEPWYDTELLAVWHLYANLHQDLAAYTRTAAQAAHDTGVPVIRPMVFLWDEPGYEELWDQYLYGPDLLVAPAWQDGTVSRTVRIPPGTWVDAWTGETLQGPLDVEVDTPLHKVPLYVRGGSGLDLGDLDAAWADAQEAVETPPDLATLAAAVGD
ncbi:MAG: glycoside hydrolase family 31 protein, partial [Deltaproteobacteria bacterium]|nr:glycoside hydrolase family 31 protein [Deltaproteobacteria bacterium]